MLYVIFGTITFMKGLIKDMKDGKDINDLVEVLKEYIPVIMKNKKFMDEIASHLGSKHNIGLGRITRYFNDFERLKEGEPAEIALITEQIFAKLDIEELRLSNWFNPIEVKRFRQYKYVSQDELDKIELPITFENVDYLGRGVYQAAVDLTIIARLYKWKLLNYNENFQRELKVSNQNGKVKKEIKVYKKNVREIKEEVLKDELDKTALAYNCAVDSSEDESEQELLYDSVTKTLEITKGTIIDILDGTHRTMGIMEAYMENPNLEGKMTVLFSNYTEEQAKKYQVSLAKATPFNKARAKELAKLRLSDELVSRMKNEGMLKGKISSINKDADRKFGYLTSSEILSDAFDKHWKIEKRGEIKGILRYFNEYLEYLFEEFEDYTDDVNNLLFNKLFFIGHVILAKRMFDNNIPLDEISDVLDGVDFDSNNPMWQKLKITNDKNRIIQNKPTIRNIENYFKNIDMKVTLN